MITVTFLYRSFIVVIYSGIRFFLEQGCETEVLTHVVRAMTRQNSAVLLLFTIWLWFFSQIRYSNKEGNEFHIFVSSRFRTLYNYQDGNETENTGHSL